MITKINECDPSQARGKTGDMERCLALASLLSISLFDPTRPQVLPKAGQEF
jgi:hypothetical protein